MQETAKQKRLVVDMSQEEHKRIKACATDRNISIKKWVMRAILKALEAENKYK